MSVCLSIYLSINQSTTCVSACLCHTLVETQGPLPIQTVGCLLDSEFEFCARGFLKCSQQICRMRNQILEEICADRGLICGWALYLSNYIFLCIFCQTIKAPTWDFVYSCGTHVVLVTVASYSQLIQPKKIWRLLLEKFTLLKIFHRGFFNFYFTTFTVSWSMLPCVDHLRQ